MPILESVLDVVFHDFNIFLTIFRLFCNQNWKPVFATEIRFLETGNRQPLKDIHVIVLDFRIYVFRICYSICDSDFRMKYIELQFPSPPHDEALDSRLIRILVVTG